VVVAPGAGNWGAIWPDLDSALVNIRNFVRDGQQHQALGVLNTTWNDDGESLVDMTWPGLVFGAAAGWQSGESSIDDFKASYDWAFYRNIEDDRTFAGVIENLDRPNSLLASLKLDNASDELFWFDPFSESGAHTAAQALPATHDLRLSAERAAETLQRSRSKAHLHADTLDAMLFAAWRLDTLGMKIQFTSEIGRFYWTLTRIKTTRRASSATSTKLWTSTAGWRPSATPSARPARCTWSAGRARISPTGSTTLLVRYDNLRSELQAKIVAVQAAQRQYWTTKILPPPGQLGFFLEP